ncbi:MAG: hypothetical protein CH6_1045 [Candidatus Kapaibacterium sp.]|nr:MAG: hypothetical protein CH6_1045 [Candidatus Kapabacteria bacterium]
MKHWQQRGCGVVGLGLEPTYKELKPFFLFNIKQTFNRLEPTYKELKLLYKKTKQ